MKKFLVPLNKGSLFYRLPIRLLTILLSFEKCTTLTPQNQEITTAYTYEHNWLDARYVVDRHRCHMNAKFVFWSFKHSGGIVNTLISDYCFMFLPCFWGSVVGPCFVVHYLVSFLNVQLS